MSDAKMLKASASTSLLMENRKRILAGVAVTCHVGQTSFLVVLAQKRFADHRSEDIGETNWLPDFVFFPESFDIASEFFRSQKFHL